MAITTAQIHQAANQINKEGKRPTLAGVRTVLGGGSFSTIQEAMKTWKSADDLNEIEATEVPEEITSAIEPMIAKVWELAEQIAGHKFDQERNDHKRELFELTESRDDAIAAADDAQTTCDQLNSALTNSTEAHNKLYQEMLLRNEALHDCEKHIAQLQATLSERSFTLKTLQETIEKLQPKPTAKPTAKKA